MSFNWKAFLDLARTLAQQAEKNEHPEAVFRTAVSRAYYGAFCHARNFAKEWLKFQPRNDAEDHGRLRAHLKAKRWRIAEKLDRLRQWRNECDYLDETNFDPSVVIEHALDEADYICTSLVPPKTS